MCYLWHLGDTGLCWVLFEHKEVSRTTNKLLNDPLVPFEGYPKTEYWVPSEGSLAGDVIVPANCPNDPSRGFELLGQIIMSRMPITVRACRGRCTHVTTEQEIGDICDYFPWPEGVEKFGV